MMRHQRRSSIPGSTALQHTKHDVRFIASAWPHSSSPMSTTILSGLGARPAQLSVFGGPKWPPTPRRPWVGSIGRSARHDRRVPLLVAYVDNLPMPPMAASQGAREGAKCLELERDRALLHMLLSSGMRREKVLTLNRADVGDGWATSALIIRKGSKERTVFWDGETKGAIRTYLEARTDTYSPVSIRLDNHREAPGPNGEHRRLTPAIVLGNRHAVL